MAEDTKYGAIFDCDGTLLASMDEWFKVEVEVAQKLGITLTEEDAAYLMTCTISSMAKYFAEHFGLAASPESMKQALEVKDWVYNHMVEFYSTQTVAKPGALDYIKALHERGVKICIASSTPEKCLAGGMQHCGFAPYIDKIFSAEEFGVDKRKPDLYLACAEYMGLAPENCWVFEDAVYALEAAQSAGFKTLGIDDGGMTGDYNQLAAVSDITISDWAELNCSFPPVKR